MRIEDHEKGTQEEMPKSVRKEEDIVKETWGNMSFWKKLEYRWMYNKIWFLGPVIFLIVVSIGVTMYKGMHTTVLLNAVVIGGDDMKAEWLEESFVQYAGIKEKDGIVQVRANIPDDGGAVTSTTALTTLMGAEAVDVLVCPKRVYDEYASVNGFLDMEEVLGEKASEYGEAVADDGVRLTDGNILEKEGMTSYDEIYAAVPVNSQNPEMAGRFIEYLLKE